MDGRKVEQISGSYRVMNIAHLLLLFVINDADVTELCALLLGAVTFFMEQRVSEHQCNMI